MRAPLRPAAGGASQRVSRFAGFRVPPGSPWPRREVECSCAAGIAGACSTSGSTARGRRRIACGGGCPALRRRSRGGSCSAAFGERSSKLTVQGEACRGRAGSASRVKAQQSPVASIFARLRAEAADLAPRCRCLGLGDRDRGVVAAPPFFWRTAGSSDIRAWGGQVDRPAQRRTTDQVDSQLGRVDLFTGPATAPVLPGWS